MALTKTLQAKIDHIIATYSNDGENISLTVDQLMAAFAPSKKVQAKAPRDPSKPKAPPTAFKRWKENEGPEIQAALERESGDTLSKRELNTYLKEMWAGMSDSEKSAYTIVTKAAQDTYKDEIKAWKSDKGIVAKPTYKKFNSSVPPPKAPAGWSDATPGYIEGSPIVDVLTGKKFTKGFRSLEEAIAMANVLGANGVTRTRVGYRVRIGKEISSTEASRAKGELSWIRK